MVPWFCCWLQVLRVTAQTTGQLLNGSLLAPVRPAGGTPGQAGPASDCPGSHAHRRLSHPHQHRCVVWLAVLPWCAVCRLWRLLARLDPLLGPL